MKKVAGLVTASTALGSDPSFTDMIPAPWSSAVKYEVLQTGTGESPKAGDLVRHNVAVDEKLSLHFFFFNLNQVEIRVKGLYKGSIFDNTFTTDQPYMYRAGLGESVANGTHLCLTYVLGRIAGQGTGRCCFEHESGRKSCP